MSNYKSIPLFSMESPDVNVVKLREVTGNPLVQKSLDNGVTDEDVQLDSKSIINLNETFCTEQKAGFWSSYINLLSTIIGAGILGLPFAVSKTGWILGGLLIVLAGILSLLGIYFLSVCALRTTLPSSFQSVADLSSLSGISLLIDVAVFLKCLGVGTSYLIVIGDLLPVAMLQFVSTESILVQRQFWIATAFLIDAPLSCMQQLDTLKWTSGISTVLILFVVIIVVFFAINPPSNSLEYPNEYQYASINVDTLKVLSIFVFAYTCQHNTFSIVNEMKVPTQRNLNKVFISAMLTAMLLYCIVAFCGYFTYSNRINSDLLKTYPDNTIVCLTRILVSVIVMFHYPLQCHPGRLCGISAISKINSYIYGTSYDKDSYYIERYIFVTLLYIAISFILACYFEDLGVVFGIIGATVSTTVSYIIPSFCYYKLHEKEISYHSKLMKLSSLTLLSIGICIIPLALYFIILH